MNCFRYSQIADEIVRCVDISVNTFLIVHAAYSYSCHCNFQIKGLGDFTGPKENTVDDFWRMMYQLETRVIVMLCNLEENGKVRNCSACSTSKAFRKISKGMGYLFSVKCLPSFFKYHVWIYSVVRESNRDNYCFLSSSTRKSKSSRHLHCLYYL